MAQNGLQQGQIRVLASSSLRLTERHEGLREAWLTQLLNPAGLSLSVYSQPATSLLVKAADPQTETEGLRPGFS